MKNKRSLNKEVVFWSSGLTEFIFSRTAGLKDNVLCALGVESLRARLILTRTLPHPK